jgi:hypothetical protein
MLQLQGQPLHKPVPRITRTAQGKGRCEHHGSALGREQISHLPGEITTREPRKDPSENPASEEPNKTPTGDLAGLDVKPALEPQGEDESDDEEDYSAEETEGIERQTLR